MTLREEYKNTLMFLNRVPEHVAEYHATTATVEEMTKHVEYGRTHLPAVDTHAEIAKAVGEGLDLYEVFS
jgi:hypothetical protein